MSVSVADPNTSGLSAANQAIYNQDIATVQSDLNSNNFTGAWGTALASSGLYDTGQSYQQTMGAATKDPLLMDMENDVAGIDPTKTWTPAQTSQFYSAFDAQGAYHGQQVTGQGGGVESLGKNPYGDWGSAAAIASGKDAAANTAQAGNTPDVGRFVGAKPTQSFLSKYGADIAAVALTAVTMGAAAPLAGALLGTEGALAVAGVGAAMGAAGTAAIDAGFGKPITAGGILGGAASGAIAGGALSGVGGFVGASVDNAIGEGGSLLGTVAGGAATGAIAGGAGAGLAGRNIGTGALLGAVGGGVGSGLGQAVTGASGSGLIGSAAGRVGSTLATGALGGALASSPAGAQGTGMASSNSGADLTSLLGIGSGLLGMNANQNQNNTQMNAYTTAGNAANSGNTWGASGVGGVGAQFANGQLNTSAGGYNPMVSGYQNLGAQQLGMAGMGTPGNVTAGYNNYMNTLGGAQAYAGAGQNTGLGMMNAGANMFNSAGTNYNSAYNTSLNSGLAALNPAIQQQSNALLNSNFERGQAGTSGGALNTQALQNSFNTADLQVQQNAVNQGLAAMNTTGNLGLSSYNAGAQQLGSFNNQQNSFGAAGMNAGMSYGMYSPQLTGAYLQNANGAVSGGSGINTMALQNGASGLAAQTNVGNQMNTGAKTQGAIGTSSNYNPGGMSYLGSLMGTASGAGVSIGSIGSSLASGLGSLFGGGGSGYNYNAANMSGPSMGMNSSGIPNSIASSPDPSSIYDGSNYQYNGSESIPGY